MQIVTIHQFEHPLQPQSYVNYWKRKSVSRKSWNSNYFTRECPDIDTLQTYYVLKADNQASSGLCDCRCCDPEGCSLAALFVLPAKGSTSRRWSTLPTAPL